MIASAPALLPCRGALLQVPDYLLSRQEEWERDEERRRADAPDPSCPPGMTLMPEEERLATLKMLEVCHSFPLPLHSPPAPNLVLLTRRHVVDPDRFHGRVFPDNVSGAGLVDRS